MAKLIQRVKGTNDLYDAGEIEGNYAEWRQAINQTPWLGLVM